MLLEANATAHPASAEASSFLRCFHLRVSNYIRRHRLMIRVLGNIVLRERREASSSIFARPAESMSAIKHGINQIMENLNGCDSMHCRWIPIKGLISQSLRWSIGMERTTIGRQDRAMCLIQAELFEPQVVLGFTAPHFDYSP